MKKVTDLNTATGLTKHNKQFFRDFSNLIFEFEKKVEDKFKSVKVPDKVKRSTANVINGKISDIKKCFPECRGYASR